MQQDTLHAEPTPRPAPTLAQAWRVWLRIGLLSFGGPAAQIALMHREIIEQRRWLDERAYLSALSFCMLLPGPEAMQIATYLGWRFHGIGGGLIAGLLFVLPGALIIAILAAIYATLGDVALVHALFVGVQATVVIIVISALIKVAQRALQHTEHWVIAGLAFVGIFFLSLPFPMIIFAAGVFGFMRARKLPAAHHACTIKISLGRTLATALIWLAIWWLPLLLIMALADASLLAQLGLLFSKLAVVTFGGAYAVLTYLGQDVVNHYGWLSTQEMIDGIGLAEATPGPLILVNEFVGFLAGFRAGGIWYGLLGAGVALWATFAPCFLWIFVGAPYLDWISSQPRLTGALGAITAAVVGVILNLSIWFALHTFFADVVLKEYGPISWWQPELASLNPLVLCLSAICALLLLKFRWQPVSVLVLAALAGGAASLLMG